MKQVMIDNETFSTRADAVILSIGAVKFDLERGIIEDDGFYASISIESNLKAGRHISDSTVTWWMGQGEDAKRLFDEPKVHLVDALISFTEWIGNDVIAPWSNGADFDVPMIAHAFDTHGLAIPWNFWNVKCFRTFKNLPGAPKCTSPAQIKHHALHDALSQAQHAIDIHKALFPPPASGMTRIAK